VDKPESGPCCSTVVHPGCCERQDSQQAPSAQTAEAVTRASDTALESVTYKPLTGSKRTENSGHGTPAAERHRM